MKWLDTIKCRSHFLRTRLTALSPCKAFIEIGADEVLAAVVVTNSYSLSGFGKKKVSKGRRQACIKDVTTGGCECQNRRGWMKVPMGHKFYVNFVGSPDATTHT